MAPPIFIPKAPRTRFPNPSPNETPAPHNQTGEFIPLSSSIPLRLKFQKPPLPQPRTGPPNPPTQETPPPPNQTVEFIPFSSSSPSHWKLRNPLLLQGQKSCCRFCIRVSSTTNGKKADSGASKPAAANETPAKIEGSEALVRSSPLPARRENPIRPKRSRCVEANTERVGGEKKAKELSFNIRLSKKEIEDDFEAMGLEPPQRLKRRPKRLDALFPATGLANLTADLCEFTSGSRKR